MSSPTEWETMMGAAGEIHQAGIPSSPVGDRAETFETFGWTTRALVLTTYFPEEDVRKGWTNAEQRAVLCDVRTIGRYSRSLFKVPVLQRTHGLWDEDLYIPRAARVDINGGTFASGSAGVDGTAPTPAEQTDGDLVLVTFLENDFRQPVILPYTLGHPRSNRTPQKADGRFRRIRHNGVSVEWDKDGNLTVDARGSAKPDLDGTGLEQSNSGVGGKIRLITKDGSGNESSVYLDENGAIKATSTSLVELGNSSAVPLTKHEPWEPSWSDLLVELQKQVQTYTAIPPPPTVAVVDYLLLLAKLREVADAFASAECNIVRGI
jgi:hypothetical protein